jgi:two-component system chemotaxis sensor kinase CheA
MAMSDDQELLALYAAEAAEHLGVLNESLLRLETTHGSEQAAERRRLIETLSRAAHSLKGASRAVGMIPVEKLAHRMESIFDAVNSNTLTMSAAIADALYDTLDTIQALLGGGDANVEAALSGLDAAMAADAPAPLVGSEVERAGQPASALAIVEPSAPGATPIRPAEESIRVTLAKLDTLMADASDLLIALSSVEQRLLDVKEVRKAHQRWQKEWRRVRTLYIWIVRQGESENPRWAGLLQFLNLTQRYMRLSGQQLLALDRALSADNLRLDLIVDSLQDSIRRVRLVPFETLVGVFQRAVRDVAHAEGKEVGLQISGVNIELDKRVLEAIKDPILHLLRNAVDHGIESPLEREQRGKAREGMIILAISQRGSNVVILIADDGQGIDVTAVRRAARRILGETEVDALSDADALALIMLPGLSTSPEVTMISGRGVGLDVVRQNVEALQGRVDIESAPGAGTTFRLVIPVSLSTLRCMLAHVGDETYAIPTSAIEQIVDIGEIEPGARFSAGGRPMIAINGRTVGLVSLADVLDRPATGDLRYAVVLAASERRMAFLVDDLITEQEMVVKNLNPELSRLKHVVGATLLGSGEVVIILNVSDLLKTAQTHIGQISRPSAMPPISRPAAPPSTILVVDDSITTRTLEKNILEAAGFEVITATHGLEALDVLGDNSCALVVADIQMPYMDGFELTSRIRHSDRFGKLPVILVTSLDSADNKERGFRAGANAYIAKGNFDQGELLQTVRQLIGIGKQVK